MKIVVAGGGGFLGRALIEELAPSASEIVLLSRSPRAVAGVRTVTWDGESQGAWVAELERAEAVVNYAGFPILSRWSAENKRRIADSRVRATNAIGQAIATLSEPPRVWVNGSATGIYGNRGSEALTEDSDPGGGFLADVCKSWEAATQVVPTPGTAVCRLRTGVVLASGHPPLSLLVRLTKLFLGCAVGDGRAYFPWVHVADHARIVRFAIELRLGGPLNATSPGIVTNREFMASLRRRMHRPWAPPLPARIVRIFGAAGFPSEPILNSTKATPARLAGAGFEWGWPNLEEALDSLLA